MAPLLNAKGQPVKMSFFDLFGGPSTPSRSGKGTSSLERKKPKKEESSSTETSPASTAATQAPTESTKTTESGSAEWTRIEDLALLGMKAQDMTWKEIDEALPGKDLEEIKKKYRQLYVDAPAAVKPNEAEAKKEKPKKTEDNKENEKDKKNEEANSGEANIAETSKKGGKEGKQVKKGQKGQKGKGKADEGQAKQEEAKVEEARPEERKGNLKAKGAAREMGKGGNLASIDGHPVIFVDDNDELDLVELCYLYNLNARYDEQKWITVDSKFFDKFGKRIGAEKLKEKLAGTT